jgi:hypothetical protein
MCTISENHEASASTDALKDPAKALAFSKCHASGGAYEVRIRDMVLLRAFERRPKD